MVEGYNATIMAYGQTGSGKSFSMQEDPNHIGIIPRAIVHIFEEIEDKVADHKDIDLRYNVELSYVEIYNEELRDLLSDKPLSEQKLEIKGNFGEIHGTEFKNRKKEETLIALGISRFVSAQFSI